MKDKRFILAVLLSTLVIFLYFTFFPPPKAPPKDKKTEGAQQEAVQGSVTATKDLTEVKEIASVQDEGKASAAKALEPMPVKVVSERKKAVIETDLYHAEIDSLNGTLTTFKLKNYDYSQEQHVNLKDWFLAFFLSKEVTVLKHQPGRMVDMVGDYSDKNQVWEFTTGLETEVLNFHFSAERVEPKDKPETLVLSAKIDEGVELMKKLTFYPGSYEVDYEVELVNRSGKAFRISPQLNFGAGNEHIDTKQMTPVKVGMSYIDGSYEKHKEGDFEDGEELSEVLWAGVMDTYFVQAAKTHDDLFFKGKYVPIASVSKGEAVKVPKFLFSPEPMNLGNNQVYSKKFNLYYGPKVQEELEKYEYHFPKVVDLGWFDILAHPLLALLRLIQGLVINWGVAIIILTIIVRVAMFPLAYKGMKSMRRMGKLNPRIKVLRDKYKGDKERLNQEIMNFYKKHKVNPVGGCLPLGMQIPIFIALYSALMPAIELRHQPFILWLNDLSLPDFTLVLPILLGVSMFVQQHLTPTPAMDPTQAKMMKWMPVFMVIFFLDMPSGLVLYWVTSNLLTIAQQLIFNKIKDSEEFAE